MPGFNDSSDAISDIADLVATTSPGATVHLLPYHRYGQQKYEMLGLDYEMPTADAPSQDFMKAACEIVKAKQLACKVTV